MAAGDKDVQIVDYGTLENSFTTRDLSENVVSYDDGVVQEDVGNHSIDDRSESSDDVIDSSRNPLDDVGADKDEKDDMLRNICNLNPNDELHSKSVSVWTSKDLTGKRFISVANAESFYKAYSMKIGFGIRKSNQKTDDVEGKLTMKRWVCNRQGQRTNKFDARKARKKVLIPHTRCFCQAAFAVTLDKNNATFKVSTFNPEHTHALAPLKQVHFFRSNREITTGQAMEIRTMREAGLKTCQIMDYMVTSLGGFDKVGFTNKDLYNFITADHERTKALSTDAEATLAHFTILVENDPGLYVKYAVDDENKLCRLFWADSRSIMDYNMYGDVVVIDSTYKTNTFKMPLVEFVGVNNHLSTVVFGSCLVSDETVDTYTWTFRTFMHAMGGKKPVVVITDGDRAIASGLSIAIPEARHRLCYWHLMRNSRSISTASSFSSDLSICMRFSFSVEEFEKQWASLLEKYNLAENEWMSDLYKKKEKWAEAYFRGIFCAGMSTSQRCESIHSYTGHFLSSNLSLYTLVKQFRRAISRIRQKTLEKEFVNHQTRMSLETHLKGLEKSAADFYSRAVFIKVRDEMLKEIKYSSVKFETDDVFKHVLLVKHGEETQREIKVSIRHFDKGLTCSCGQFESFGWPCRHMFCAMKAFNMKEIPEVMLKRRWAKDYGSHNGDICVDMQSETLHPEERRFGSLHAKVYQLCQLASKSEDLYKRAMSEVQSTISGLLAEACNSNDESNTVKRRRLEVNCKSIIQDPDIVRTKGSQSEDKTGKGKPRCCTNCNAPGHYKPNCPLLKGDIGPSEGVESMNEVDDSDDDLF